MRDNTDVSAQTVHTGRRGCQQKAGRVPALKTAAMFSTTSQARSLEGRAGASRAAWEIVKDHPLLGVGSFNFPIHYAAYKEEGAAYAGRTFNIFLQILVEKGVVGLLGYCLLFFGFFKDSHEKLRRPGATRFKRP